MFVRSVFSRIGALGSEKFSFLVIENFAPCQLNNTSLSSSWIYRFYYWSNLSDYRGRASICAIQDDQERWRVGSKNVWEGWSEHWQRIPISSQERWVFVFLPRANNESANIQEVTFAQSREPQKPTSSSLAMEREGALARVTKTGVLQSPVYLQQSQSVVHPRSRSERGRRN